MHRLQWCRLSLQTASGVAEVLHYHVCHVLHYLGCHVMFEFRVAKLGDKLGALHRHIPRILMPSCFLCTCAPWFRYCLCPLLYTLCAQRCSSTWLHSPPLTPPLFTLCVQALPIHYHQRHSNVYLCRCSKKTRVRHYCVCVRACVCVCVRACVCVCV